MNPRIAQPHWPEIFTDWCVIRAFGTTKRTAVLDLNITQAALVSEVSAYLRFHALGLREADVETRMAIAAEAAFEQVGESFYAHTRDAFEKAQTDFLLRIAHAARSPGDASVRDSNPASPQLAQCRIELDRLRRRAQPTAKQARRRAAEKYWAEIAACRLPRVLRWPGSARKRSRKIGIRIAALAPAPLRCVGRVRTRPSARVRGWREHASVNVTRSRIRELRRIGCWDVIANEAPEHGQRS